MKWSIIAVGKKVGIKDDDFTHDTILWIDGDFSSTGAKMVYATTLAEKLNLGATGKFPGGKLNDDDEGELRTIIKTDGDNVVIDFGKSVAWLALPKKDAIALGKILIEQGDRI